MKSLRYLILLSLVLSVCGLTSFSFTWSKKNEVAEEKAKIKELRKEKKKLIKWKEQNLKVKKYLVEGNKNKVRSMFDKDVKKFDKMISKKKYEEVEDLLKKMDYVYTKNNVYKDDVAFKEAELLLNKGDILAGTEKMEFIVTEFPDSDLINMAIERLQRIYLRADKNEDVKRLSKFQKGFPGPQQEYLVAQAYFNLDDFDAAIRKFESLKSEKRYSYKASQMLIIIDGLNGNVEKALDDIDLLLSKDYEDEASYNVSLLIKARLLTLSSNLTLAVNNYETYISLQRKNADSAPYYELADIYYSEGNLEEAEKLANKAVEIADDRDVFVDSKYLLASIEQSRGNIEKAELLFNEAKEKSIYFVSLLDQKYSLFREMKTEISRNSEDIKSDEQRKEIKKERLKRIDEIVSRLDKVNENIEKNKALLGRNEVEKLELLEKKYVESLETIDEHNLKINHLNNTTNKEIPEILDDYKVSLDDDIVFWNSIRYVRNIDEPTRFDYDKAYLYAQERQDFFAIKELCGEINDLLEEKQMPDKQKKVSLINELIDKNIESVDKDIVDEFGIIDETNPRQFIARQELDATMELKDIIVELKKSVKKNYNNKLAGREAHKKDLVLEKVTSLETRYQDLQNKLIDSLKDINEKYEVNLLDVLYQQTKSLDAEYEKKYFEE